MINWACFLAVLAAASAAPQNLQSVSAPRTQTIRVQQLPGQTFSSVGQQYPVQTFSSVPQQFPVQTFSSVPQQFPVQTFSSVNQQFPVQTYSSVPVQTFSSSAIPVQYQQYQQYHQIPIQSVQTLPAQQVVSHVPSVSHVQSVQSVQSAQPYQVQVSNVPVSNIRFDTTSRPVNTRVTQFRTQSTALPVVQATPTPTVRISSTPVSLPAVSVAPVQVRTEQVHHIPVTQQVHHIPVTQQVHHLPVTQVHHVQPAVQHRIVQTAGPVEHRIQTSRNEGGFAILRQVQDVQADGTYEYAYETENGIKAQEHGELKNPGTENESNSVTGSYSYTDPEGRQISVSYIADENGFRAEGDHIPKVPEPILRSLEYLRSLPQNQDEN